MPLVSPARLLTPLTAALLIAVACGSRSVFASPIPVEVWRGGDDGLTIKLVEALKIAVRASPDFTLSTGERPGSLIVTIPTNVHWKQVDGRIQVLYKVEFTSTDGRKLGNGAGSCWDSALSNCAAHILADAKIAASRAR